MTRLDAGALSPERLAHEMEDAVRILRAPETRRACGTLLTMMAIAEHPTIGAKEIGGYYQHFCGERSRAAWRTCCAGAWGKTASCSCRPR